MVIFKGGLKGKISYFFNLREFFTNNNKTQGRRGGVRTPPPSLHEPWKSAYCGKTDKDTVK